MFWQFETGIVSQIDTILDGPNPTVRSLMDEDDIIQECKASNQKLLQFLIKPETVDELVSMITTEPEQAAEEKSRYKYANIACELLTSDLSLINDALSGDQAVLNKLCGFLDTGKDLNPLLASFFSKTFGLLCVKRTDVLFEYLKTKDNFVQLLLEHIETSAVMDLLLKLLTGVDNIDLRGAILKWLSEKGLVRSLIAMFKSGVANERQVNAAQFLCDMVKASREHQSLLQDKADPDPLLDELESTDAIAELLSNMFDTRTECALVNGIRVLQALLEYKRHCANISQPAVPPSMQSTSTSEFEGIPPCLAHPMFKDMAADQVSPLDAERLTKGVLQVQSAIVPRLSDFHDILLNPPQKSPIQTSVGVITKPLGATRLEVVHLIRALLCSNNPEVNQKLVELKTVPVLIVSSDAFVEQSIKSVLNNLKTTSPVTSPDPTTSTFPNLISQEVASLLTNDLFETGQLLQKILDAWALTKSNAAAKQPRPGYMGHVTKLANHILDFSTEDLIREKINNLSPEVGDSWKDYTENTLAEINKRIQTPLVNEMPSNSFEEDVTRQENALHQAFIEYQMQQMTRNLCTQIGFVNTNEFTDLDDVPIQPQLDQLSKINFSLDAQMEQTKSSDLFEQICSDRIKSSDSNSSDDDDYWEEKESSPRLVFQPSEDVADKSEDFGNFVSSNTEDSKETKMDIDNPSDPWAPVEGSNIASLLMDTADPWNSDSGKGVGSREGDSWADFASFGGETLSFPTEASAPPNMCAPSTSTSSLDGPQPTTPLEPVEVIGSKEDAPQVTDITSEPTDAWVTSTPDNESKSSPPHSTETAVSQTSTTIETIASVEAVVSVPSGDSS